MTIIRYDCAGYDAGMQPARDGDWVCHHDHEKALREARVDGMRALLAVGNGAAACYPDQYGDVWGAASYAMAEFIAAEKEGKP